MFTSYLIFETINMIKTGNFPLLIFLSLCHLYHYHSLKIYHCKRQGSQRNGKRKISVKWKILVRHTRFFFFSPDSYSSASVEMVYNTRTKVCFGTLINRKICFWHSHTIFGTWVYHHGTMCHIHSRPLSVLDFVLVLDFHDSTLDSKPESINTCNGHGRVNRFVVLISPVKRRDKNSIYFS